MTDSCNIEHMKKMLEKYAEVLIQKGVNLQENQELVIDSDIENYAFVRILVDVAYKHGAKNVIVQYSDEVVDHKMYEYLSLDELQNIPPHIIALREQYALSHAAILSLTSEDPDGFKDIDPKKVATYHKAMHLSCPTFYDHLDLGIDRWCIAAASSFSWAKKVYPSLNKEEAVNKLWEDIFKVCFIDTSDPLLSFDQHRRSFEDRVKILNESHIRSLHYTNSLGTNLTIGTLDDYLFAGGGSYTTDGLYSFPNIPTYEIFSSPNKYKVDGIVYNSLPLNYNGLIIDHFYIEFKEGRIVEYHADVGEEVLKEIIESDEGSHYLGEMALVPYSSPINQLNTLFYNTLLDENASCHLAIGKGFCECVKDGYTLDKQGLLEKGINDSSVHVDFMIGTQDLNITATLENGKSMVIFNKGEFTF